MTDQLNLFDASAKPETTEPTPIILPPEIPGADSAGQPPALPPSANGPADDIPSPADYAARRYLEYAMSVVTGRALPYHPRFYLHLGLLHLALVLRVTGDLAAWPVARQWGGLLNEVAILLFIVSSAAAVMAAQRRPGAVPKRPAQA